MPKASKEETERVRTQAQSLYEEGKYTLERICQIIKQDGGLLSRQTLSKWVVEGEWQAFAGIEHKEGAMKEKKEQQKKERNASVGRILEPIVRATVEEVVKMQEEEKQGQNDMPLPAPQPLPPSTPPHPEPQKIIEPELQKAIDIMEKNIDKIEVMTKAIVNRFVDDKSIENLYKSNSVLMEYRIRELFIKNTQYKDGQKQETGLQSAANYLRLAQAHEAIGRTLGFISANNGVNVFNQNNNSVEAVVNVKDDAKEKAINLLASVIE